MEQWKKSFFHCSIVANFFTQKKQDMFSTKKEYVFDAKRASFFQTEYPFSMNACNKNK